MILMLLVLAGCAKQVTYWDMNLSGFTNNSTTTDVIIFENSSHRTKIEHKIEQKYFEINLDYPGLNYNKQQISQEEVARFRKIMSSIPAEYFEDVEYISLTNKQHPGKEYQAYIYCENYKCHIRHYELMYLFDDEIYNLILHELGHKHEYKELTKHYGDGKIFGEEGLSEYYAENWRKQHGGNQEDNYSSDRTIC